MRYTESKNLYDHEGELMRRLAKAAQVAPATIRVISQELIGMILSGGMKGLDTSSYERLSVNRRRGASRRGSRRTRDTPT